MAETKCRLRTKNGEHLDNVEEPEFIDEGESSAAPDYRQEPLVISDHDDPDPDRPNTDADEEGDAHDDYWIDAINDAGLAPSPKCPYGNYFSGCLISSPNCISEQSPMTDAYPIVPTSTQDQWQDIPRNH